jgi:hypothetical protein
MDRRRRLLHLNPDRTDGLLATRQIGVTLLIANRQRDLLRQERRGEGMMAAAAL